MIDKAGVPDERGARSVALPGVWKRVAMTFFAPRRLFSSFDASTPWMGVLLLSTAVAVIAAPVKPAGYYLRQMARPMDRLGRPVVVTSSADEIVRNGRMLDMLSALPEHPLIFLGLAGLLTLLFTWLGRGRTSFREYLPVAGHALLIPALGTLVGLAMAISSGDLEAQPTVARLLSFAGPRVANDPFLGAVDVFSLWMLVTLGIAVATLERRRSWLLTAGPLVAAYLVVAAVTGYLLR